MAGGVERAVAGALAGLTAAGCMTLIRMTAKRLGLIDKMVPQVLEEWAAEKAGAKRGDALLHHAADHVLHFGYAVAAGGVYALAAERLGHDGGGSLARKGALYGLGVFGFGFVLVMPLLKATRPPWRASAAENGVNVASHLAFGVVTALVADDLLRQRNHRGRPGFARKRDRYG